MNLQAEKTGVQEDTRFQWVFSLKKPSKPLEKVHAGWPPMHRSSWVKIWGFSDQNWLDYDLFQILGKNSSYEWERLFLERRVQMGNDDSLSEIWRCIISWHLVNSWHLFTITTVIWNVMAMKWPLFRVAVLHVTFMWYRLNETECDCVRLMWFILYVICSEC